MVFAPDVPARIHLPDLDASRVRDVKLLGNDTALMWRTTDNGVALTLPDLPAADKQAQTFTLQLTIR